MPTIAEVEESIARIEAALKNCDERDRPRLHAELLFHQQQHLTLMQMERARIDRQNANLEFVLDILKKRREK